MPKKAHNTTSKRDYRLFCHYVHEYVQKLSLGQYELNLAHVEGNDARASMYVNSGVIANISLYKDWGEAEVTDEEIRLAALHEVLHLLLHRLMWVAHERFVTKGELDRVEHDIVYSLEKVL